MKKLIPFMVCCIGLTIGAITPANAQKQNQGQKNNLTFPYKATYSSNFEMGDPARSRVVLELWKDYDDNNFDQHADRFADTASIYLASGELIKGRDNMLAAVKKYRGALASVKTEVHAWMSLRSIDHNENWVAVWGTEEDTGKDGQKSSVMLHEIWRFNKAGKIDQVMQFVMQPGMQE